MCVCAGFFFLIPSCFLAALFARDGLDKQLAAMQRGCAEGWISAQSLSANSEFLSFCYNPLAGTFPLEMTLQGWVIL